MQLGEGARLGAEQIGELEWGKIAQPAGMSSSARCQVAMTHFPIPRVVALNRSDVKNHLSRESNRSSTFCRKCRASSSSTWASTGCRRRSWSHRPAAWPTCDRWCSTTQSSTGRASRSCWSCCHRSRSFIWASTSTRTSCWTPSTTTIRETTTASPPTSAAAMTKRRRVSAAKVGRVFSIFFN